MFTCARCSATHTVIQVTCSQGIRYTCVYLAVVRWHTKEKKKTISSSTTVMAMTTNIKCQCNTCASKKDRKTNAKENRNDMNEECRQTWCGSKTTCFECTRWWTPWHIHSLTILFSHCMRVCVCVYGTAFAVRHRSSIGATTDHSQRESTDSFSIIYFSAQRHAAARSRRRNKRSGQPRIYWICRVCQ